MLSQLLPLAVNLTEKAPAFAFLNWGWWVVHVIAILVVFGIGYKVGKSKGSAPAGMD